MKTKAKKIEELGEAKELLAKSKAVLFADFEKVSAEDLRKLRREVRTGGAQMLVLKKRLLNVLFKEEGIEFDARQFAGSIGAIFSFDGVEKTAGPFFKFFTELGGTDKEAKAVALKKVLGGYDVVTRTPIERATVVMIGQLPPREVLLAQFLGMLAAPIRSMLYILKEKSQKVA